MNRITACATITVAWISTVATADLSDTYFNDFSNGGGTHYGSSFVTTFNGHADLQLVSDGQPGTHGTWQAEPFANRTITSFNASFKFSFNTNGNGGVGDGFSFLFGDMSDMSGDRWAGGEYGLNAFNDMGSGMAVGFDSYGGDSGIHALWGGTDIAWTNFGTEWWALANYSDYNQALDDYWQGTIQINWDNTSGLQVGISWPGYPMWWGLETGMFVGIPTDNFGFGFAARNGGIDNDVLIDLVDIAYTYILTEEIAGDANGDGAVDFLDIVATLSAWGPCTESCSEDFDNDGQVGFSDILIILNNWS